MKERLQKFPPHKRAAESRTLCREILKVLPDDPSLTVAAYVPLTDEADIRPLLKELLARNIALYLPCFEHRNFTFRRAKDLESLLPGALRIPEPSREAEPLDPALLTIALIPGRAFDRNGHRIGRGNGGYDVWIAKHRKANPLTRIYGVALECQVVSNIPEEAHDQRVDSVITARGIV